MQRLQSLHAGLVRQFRQALVRSMSTDSAAVVESSTSSSALTGRQEHVRFITPQNSRRNFARRLLARQLQVAVRGPRHEYLGDTVVCWVLSCKIWLVFVLETRGVGFDGVHR